MQEAPLMPKATAVWLVEHTALSFDQVADFCKLHPLEVKAIADGDAAQGIKGLDPIQTGQLTREEIEKGAADPEHKLLLSRQALEIAQRNCAGRKADEPLFPIVDARKTLSWINQEAETQVQGHGLRATFASIAEELVSSAFAEADDESRCRGGRDSRALCGQERGAASSGMAGCG